MKRILENLWSKWKFLGEKLGNFIARVFLSVFYFSILIPFVIVDRISRSVNKNLIKPPGTFWEERETTNISFEDFRKQS